MRKLKAALAFIALLLCLTLLGCYDGAEGNMIKVDLVVTENLGEKVIFDETINAVEGDTVLDILVDNLDVDIAHGGFVNSIEGLESGAVGKKKSERQKTDWLYFVNGITSNIGAGDYILQADDVVWWDYRLWDDAALTPAVCGSFPQPFLNGFRGFNPKPIILYGDSFESQAKAFQTYLEQIGVEQVEIGKYDENELEIGDNIYIVLETSEKIANSSYWKDIMNNRRKTGCFVGIDDNGIIGYDLSGQDTQLYSENAGAVIVVGQGMGNPSSIWLFTAMEDEILEEMLIKIQDEPAHLRYKAGAIYHSEEFIPLPLR